MKPTPKKSLSGLHEHEHKTYKTFSTCTGMERPCGKDLRQHICISLTPVFIKKKKKRKNSSLLPASQNFQYVLSM